MFSNCIIFFFVLDAISNEPWGPHGSYIADIANAPRNYNEYPMIMSVMILGKIGGMYTKFASNGIKLFNIGCTMFSLYMPNHQSQVWGEKKKKHDLECIVKGRNEPCSIR
ncbi:ENTH/VHS family protein [Striga asiatica]|uniref:ENTH/VHS family protein n=1 Tax=Striga asiatica TaxID=4170 RepID=A0A5A7RBN4_STRAF|nr:ENTH/VHS family protein [Striga asiatica]